MNGLVAIKAIADYVWKFGAAVSAWYVSKQQQATLQEIADAAAFAIHNCDTEEGRYQAAEKWRQALSRPRMS